MFDEEDPNCKLSFEGVDRSNIEATPDNFVTEGTGFEIFLKAGRHQQILPNQAVGDNRGPAIMNYGRALETFGVPAGSGPNPQQNSEPTAEPPIEDKVAESSVADAPTASLEPKTERERRQQEDFPKTAPLLSEEEQWALFSSSRFTSDASLLARQYTSLVLDKERKERKERREQKKGKKGEQSENDKQSDENSAPEPVVPETTADTVNPDSSTVPAADSEKWPTDSKGWPTVEHLDWTGFTNWISRCTEADKLFEKETLKTWRNERSQRIRTLTAKLRQ